jgi:hypothetical protein
MNEKTRVDYDEMLEGISELESEIKKERKRIEEKEESSAMSSKMERINKILEGEKKRRTESNLAIEEMITERFKTVEEEIMEKLNEMLESEENEVEELEEYVESLKTNGKKEQRKMYQDVSLELENAQKTLEELEMLGKEERMEERGFQKRRQSELKSIKDKGIDILYEEDTRWKQGERECDTNIQDIQKGEVQFIQNNVYDQIHKFNHLLTQSQNDRTQNDQQLVDLFNQFSQQINASLKNIQ